MNIIDSNMNKTETQNDVSMKSPSRSYKDMFTNAFPLGLLNFGRMKVAYDYNDENIQNVHVHEDVDETEMDPIIIDQLTNETQNNDDNDDIMTMIMMIMLIMTDDDK